MLCALPANLLLNKNTYKPGLTTILLNPQDLNLSFSQKLLSFLKYNLIMAVVFLCHDINFPVSVYIYNII